MKTRFYNLLVMGMVLLTLGACEKEDVRAVLNPGSAPVVTLSSPTVVLTKENADQDALTVSWAKPDYGFNAPAAYTILMDKKGGDFTNAITVSTGSELRKTFKASELNPMLLKLGLVAGTAADIDLKVQSDLGPGAVLMSAVSSVKATPYLDKLDLSSTWGLVGSATANSWDGPDQPFYKTDQNNVFVAYVTLTDGEIKIRQDNKWDVNYGGTGGTLKAGGDNIVVKAGNYRVTINMTALTYAIEPFSWGIVGSAAPNGWDGPDAPFVYDPSTDQWRAVVTLKDGDIKFRQNNAWTVNYGGAAGTLKEGGDNIAVKAGTYLVTADFKPTGLKYTIEPFNAWGLVGSAAPKGWDGPDAQFQPSFVEEGIWTLSKVTLKDGEIKFRQNNKWDENLGDSNADGILEKGGGNITVKAGIYDIQLDLTNASRQTYKLTKK
ncbi:SusE domain-containing protein [Spirosoma sordidisoli]|uniref:SusF/SusE family outer membrane protein n=1 Tax=Spirosoma sordidisoli TaxID=2502893 RepID=A0A4Q2UK88_9BACT|nr:SusE domain-containing protein [Spirosoma sordidisoli]RYC67905.1 SusF/SusE family outer membrane protein [Spirosoma sordidisoli]